MVLNRNPVNYFAEVEQIAFDPASMPPGIEPSPDKMLQVCTRISYFWSYVSEGFDNGYSVVVDII